MGLDWLEIELGLSDRYVVIRVSEPWIAKWFLERFAGCSGERSACLGGYSIRRLPEGELRAEGPGNFSASGSRLEDLAEPLVQHFLERLAVGCSRGLACHAAGVSRLGKGLILTGKSGSGKSTLTSACLKRGFDYLSDEVVCVSATPLRMTGFPRPVNLKPGSSFVVQEWLSPEARVDRMWKNIHWIDPSAFGSGSTVAETTPALIVFPQYLPQIPLLGRSLEQAESLIRLMQLYVNKAHLPEAGFRTAARLARRLPCWELRFSKALEAAEWLEDRLAASEAH